MYRVELSVSDLKDDAVFVAFDMEIVTFTSIRASEAAQILGTSVNYHVYNEIPQFL